MKKRVKKKRVKYGWIKDLSACYDYDTGGLIKNIKRKDDSLKYFSFGLEGTLERRDSDRVVLHLPLVAEKKAFWQCCRQLSRKVKVTIEYV